MRIMAVFVFFSFIVACSLRQVFAVDCKIVGLGEIRNCNDCIRCGGNWCNRGETPHCSSSMNDNWCQGEHNREELPSIKQERLPGTLLSPSYYAITALIGQHSPRLLFSYNWKFPDSPNVDVTVINSTQNYVEIVEKQTKCSNGVCKTHVAIRPATDFCSADSGKEEFVYVGVRVDNVTEDATIKYHVPCACKCSDTVDRNSKICNGNGDFSCGVCNCNKGWAGDFCDSKPKCEGRRGDVQCTNPFKNDVECSGNGKCGECDTCICNTEGEGYQYFDQDNYCADLPMYVSTVCDTCLRDFQLTEGRCKECSGIIQPCNETLLQQRDELNRTIWVRFKDSVDGAEYAAMKDYEGQIFIMRMSSCLSSAEAIGIANVNVTLPTVLGIVAIVAAATAVAGYMVWKARHAPMPLNASQYQELDGPENSAGINPLYKPPTSSYNNPMWKGGAKV